MLRRCFLPSDPQTQHGVAMISSLAVLLPNRKGESISVFPRNNRHMLTGGRRKRRRSPPSHLCCCSRGWMMNMKPSVASSQTIQTKVFVCCVGTIVQIRILSHPANTSQMIYFMSLYSALIKLCLEARIRVNATFLTQPELIKNGTMWSSCGLNTALFREYLSAVVSSLMDHDWLSFCTKKGALQKIPRPEHLCSPFCWILDLVADLPVHRLGIGGKFLRSVKRLVIHTGKPGFFVSCETLDTGKWASPCSHLQSLRRGGKDLQQQGSFLPIQTGGEEIWYVREKLELRRANEGEREI